MTPGRLHSLIRAVLWVFKKGPLPADTLGTLE
mgnify:CR=1 FL=1